MRRKDALTALAGLAASLLLAGALHAGTDCDTYQPSCGDGNCDCGSCDAPSCGCEPACDGGCDTKPTCGCGNCKQSLFSMKGNPVYRTLDAVAGGIEHVLGLDRCGAGCGKHCDGCDSCGCSETLPIQIAAPGSEWSAPMPPISDRIREPRNVSPRKPAPRPAPMIRSEPTLPEVPPLEEPAAEPAPLRMSEPRIVEPKADAVPEPVETMPLAPETIDPEPELTVPAPQLQPMPIERSPHVPVPDDDTSSNIFGGDDPVELPPATPEERAQPRKGGSIFDALDDPFSDDEARARRPYGSVQPTVHRTRSVKTRAATYRPVRVAPLARPPAPAVSPKTQASDEPVGTGLRRATRAAELRPVSHEEPTLVPVSRGRVAAPYRVSR